MNGQWVPACAEGDVQVDDILRFDHGDRTFAIYHPAAGR